MEREKQPVVTLEEMLKGVRREYSKAKYCLHPKAGKDCSGLIIQAHTIQRSGGLLRIAQYGKIMDFGGSGAEIIKAGRITPRLVGTKEASVFTGFCGSHDSEMFKPIETEAFVGSDQQCFLLAYRAMCHELYERQIAVGLIPFLQTMDRGRPVSSQVSLQSGVKQYAAWITYYRDCTLHHKQLYDNALRKEDYSQIKSYIVKLEQVPDIMCSAAFCPRFDFRGNVLQWADTSRIFDIITCSVIAADEGGVVVLSWFGQSNACERFTRSLDAFSDDALSQAVVRWLFYSFKNVYGRPAWWHGLDGTTKQRLLRRREIGMSPDHSLHPNAYVEDGVKTVEWKITSRQRNFS